MVKNLPYKKRFYYLLVTGFLVYLFAYLIAISATVKTRHAINELDLKLKKISSAPLNVALIERNISIADSKIGENPVDIMEFQKKLLDHISIYCAQNGLVLKDFPKVHNLQKQNYQFMTGYANIEGPFIPLLKLLYLIETSSKGKIVSVSFHSTEDRRVKRSRLTMSVYVQSIKQTSNVQIK